LINANNQHTLRRCFSALLGRFMGLTMEVVRRSAAGYVQQWRPAVTSVPPASQLPIEEPFPGTSLATVTTHLEFLGYTVRPSSDGWLLAEHPYRNRFSLREFGWGINLCCSFRGGLSLDHTRGAWMDFINRSNGAALLVRFFLEQNDQGDYVIMVRARVTCAYERRAFSTVMDLWHDDIRLLNGRPVTKHEGESASTAGVVPMLVH
jgi:hypothetical protein